MFFAPVDYGIDLLISEVHGRWSSLTCLRNLGNLLNFYHFNHLISILLKIVTQWGALKINQIVQFIS